MAESFSQQSDTFISWFKGSGATISPKISLQDLRSQNAGRGVGTVLSSSHYPLLNALANANSSSVALSDIDTNEVLFTIPRSLVLSVQNSSFSTQHKDSLAQLGKEPWLELILVMLYEYGRGDGSRWKAYFDILPSEFDTLMYWTPAELGELQASAVVNKIGKETADALFKEKITPLVMNKPDTFGFTSEVGEQQVLDRAHRMASTIMAYAFDIEPQERDVDEEGYATEEDDADLEKGMVPLADMLNADADRNNVGILSFPIPFNRVNNAKHLTYNRHDSSTNPPPSL
jgi:SET domain-containing protein 6